MYHILPFLAISVFLPSGTFAARECKTTPLDSTWPSDSEWSALNNTVNGTLLRTTPIASSCWPGNPFNSPLSCDVVTGNWSSGIFHAELPESVDYPIFANNSCLPPGASGYDEKRGCGLGGLPEFILNATSEAQVATAMKWASQRNVRIVVKGTGHDMNARSSGAYSLSIWTRNLNKIEYHDSWALPDGQKEEHVFVVGSGQQWGNILTQALALGRVVTTGQDPSVGLGGYIQGGGHGPLSSTYGLAAHQVLQVTIITTEGHILVANDSSNQDIFWAVRGGGGGQYGVVTEYVIRTHPAPSMVTIGTIQIAPKGEAGANSSWSAAAALMSKVPDVMDAGLAGAGTMATGDTATKFFPSLDSPTTGVAVNQIFFGYNMTPAAMATLVSPVLSAVRAEGSNQTLSVTWSASQYADYKSFFSVISGSDAAGGESVMSSRLLGRRELSDTPKEKVASYLRTALKSQDPSGTYVTIGLQGGPGVASVPDSRWGAVNPVWRSTYLHFITTGATMNSTSEGGPQKALDDAATWLEDVKEAMWREWAADTGAYMNEANPFNTQWKHDFYGTTYDRLLEIKKKYDPTESLYVINGVGSEDWEYDLDSGRLCRTE